VAKNISTPPAGRLAWLRARMAWLRLSAGANGWGPRYGFVWKPRVPLNPLVYHHFPPQKCNFVDIPHFQADPYLINHTALVYVVALPKNPKNSIALGKSCGTSEALGGSRCCLRPLSHAQQHPQGWEWRFSNMIPELLGLWRMIFVDVRFHVSFHGCKACGNESLRTGVDALVVGFLQQQLLHTCLKFYLSEISLLTRMHSRQCSCL
jgi:hypothetical protein